MKLITPLFMAIIGQCVAQTEQEINLEELKKLPDVLQRTIYHHYDMQREPNLMVSLYRHECLQQPNSVEPALYDKAFEKFDYINNNKCLFLYAGTEVDRLPALQSKRMEHFRLKLGEALKRKYLNEVKSNFFPLTRKLTKQSLQQMPGCEIIDQLSQTPPLNFLAILNLYSWMKIITNADLYIKIMPLSILDRHEGDETLMERIKLWPLRNLRAENDMINHCYGYFEELLIKLNRSYYFTDLVTPEIADKLGWIVNRSAEFRKYSLECRIKEREDA